MGLSALRGSAVYEYVSTWIPRESDVTTWEMYDEYSVSVLPRYMNTLGTMCDYGVRIRYPNHDFGYIEIGMAQRGDTDLSHLLTQDYLTAEDAYMMAVESTKIRKLSNAMYQDYAVLTERAVGMYEALRLDTPYFGRYYKAEGRVKSFECDCASNKSIVDMKVSRTSEHCREYWIQVLLYSLLAHQRDGKCRRRLVLLYPVQGELKQFVMTPQEYIALADVFDRMYEEEIVCI